MATAKNTISLFGISIFVFIFTVCNIGVSHSKDKFMKCSSVNLPDDMKCIPGGIFIRGSNESVINEDTQTKIKDEFPEMKIVLSTFLIDTNEVTYSQYQECVKNKECSPARPNYKGYSNPKQPMVGLNWYQARDYCKWLDKRLPTESEWEKAARGTSGEIFPWGNEAPDCSKAVIKEKGKKGCGTGKTWNISTRPPYRYGLYDMAGNSWEWVNDWYSKNYQKCGNFCKGTDPKGPCNGKDECHGHRLKVVKGGSWWWEGKYARASNRRAHYPLNKPYHHYGFRCAKDVQ